VVAGAASDGLAEILDLAGTVMVVGPGRDDGPFERSLRAGHTLAAGWLAVRSAETGIIGMPGGLLHTVSAVTGHAVHLAVDADPLPRQIVDNPRDRPPKGVRLADLLEKLS